MKILAVDTSSKLCSVAILEDKNLRKEIKNPFYEFAQDEKVCKNILKEFGINEEEGRIIGGHMPVKLKDGESPIKANGKLLIRII